MIDGRRGRAGKKESRPGPAPESEKLEPVLTANVTEQSKPRRGPGPFLARHGVTADQVTLAGLVMAAATGAVIALGYLWGGVALVAVGGLMDTLDGSVAKAAGSSSRRGAFLDSVSDRVADGFMFGGLAWYLAAGRTPVYAILPFAILAVGNVISYERAKAELLGWEAKGGLMERAERLIFLAIALLFNVVLIPLLLALLALCIFTALQRFLKIWRQATAELRGEPMAARRQPAAIGNWRPAKVESRWLEWRRARLSGRSLERPMGRSSRSRRRDTVPLSTRVRAMLASERAGVATRPSARLSSRHRQRRSEKAASALSRRLGSGR